MIHFTLAIVATILVCSNLERIDFIRCAKAMCISATLVSVFCIFQGIGLDPMKTIAVYGHKESRHIAALLDHPDMVGNYLCMIIPLFLYFRKPKYYLCLTLVVVALLLTRSSISIGSAVLAGVVYLGFRFYKSRAVIISLLVVMLGFGIFCATHSSFNKLYTGFTGRTTAWKMMVDRTNNPLFGQGLGSVAGLNVVTGDNYWVFAHNDYLMVWIELGALGLFLLVLLIIHTFKKFNYKEDNDIGFAYYGSFIAFLIVMFGSFPMEFPPVALNGLIVYWALART
jgi:O-antigen ligase